MEGITQQTGDVGPVLAWWWASVYDVWPNIMPALGQRLVFAGNVLIRVPPGGYQRHPRTRTREYAVIKLRAVVKQMLILSFYISKSPIDYPT